MYNITYDNPTEELLKEYIERLKTDNFYQVVFNYEDKHEYILSLLKDWTTYYYPSINLIAANKDDKRIRIFKDNNLLIMLRTDLYSWDFDCQLQDEIYDTVKTKEYSALNKGINLLKSFFVDILNKFIKGETAEMILSTSIPRYIVYGILKMSKLSKDDIVHLDRDYITYSTDCINIVFEKGAVSYTVFLEFQDDLLEMIEEDVNGKYYPQVAKLTNELYTD